MKGKKIIKRVLLGLGVFLLLLVGFLVSAPFLFKDKIIAAVKDVVNQNLNATVDFKEVDVSLLRSFPDVSLKIADYSVVGVNEFEGVELASGEAFSVAVDFWSAWNFGKVPLNIRSVRLDKPEINVVVLSDGRANYDIAKPTSDTSAATPFEIKLQEYGIYDASLTYDDRQGGTLVKAKNLTHTGVGDFTQDIYDLTTKTAVEELTAESGGIPYLKKANVKLDAGINVDMPKSRYTLKENVLTINDLQVKADGWLAMPNENDMDMDLKFSAPQSDFKALLSLIPNAYVEGFENVKAGGTFKLEGFVKGRYSASPEIFPAFNIALDIMNGDVKYPDLPLGISNINTNLVVNSPESDLDKMLVDVSKFSLKIGSNPLEGWFKLRTPMSDPDVDTNIKGVLNLEELGKAFPMEGVQSLNGMMHMDVAMKTKMSMIDAGDYENMQVSGEATIQNMNYAAEGTPPVKINTLQAAFTPQRVRLDNFDMKLGKSDLSGSGSVDNILAWFSPEKTMKGNFILRSNYFNADEWAGEETPAATTTAAPAPAAAEDELFNRFDFTLDAALKQVDYDVYKIKDLVAKGNFTPNKLAVSQLSGKIGESDFSASGVLTNVWNYLFSNETLGGNLALRSNYMNLNQFMTEAPATATATSSTATAASSPVLVPANVNVKVDASMGRVTYTNMDLTSVKGTLAVANEEVKFDNLAANTLGGSIGINGGYSTRNHDKPRFDLDLKLQQMDFQKSFNTFNTFKAMAPVGKFIQGVFNTTIKMSSDLTPDLMPDLGTLTAEGFLHTLNGAIRGFKPLEEVGSKLNVAAFKNLSIKNTKNWFTVKNGAVDLKEFDYTFEDIAMRIGGSHKLSGDMAYNIVAKIPRSKIGKNPLGAAANTGLDFLGKEASKLGLNLDAGEFVNVQISIGGTLTDPKIGFKVLGTDGKSSVQDQAVDAAKKEAQAQLDKAKAEAEAKLEAEKKKAEAAAAAAVKKAEAEAARKVEEAAKKAGAKASETAKEQVGSEAAKKAEEAKKKAEELFKKKKKKDGGG